MIDYTGDGVYYMICYIGAGMHLNCMIYYTAADVRYMIYHMGSRGVL